MAPHNWILNYYWNHYIETVRALYRMCFDCFHVPDPNSWTSHIVSAHSY